MDKRLIAIGALAVVVVAALVVYYQWGEHTELNGKITAVRTQAVTDTDSVVVVDCELVNPADVVFEVDEVTALMTPAQGEPAEGVAVAARDVARLVDAYPALQGPALHPPLKTSDVIGAHKSSRRTLMFQFAGVAGKDFAQRKSLTVRIRERLGYVGEIKESR